MEPSSKVMGRDWMDASFPRLQSCDTITRKCWPFHRVWLGRKENPNESKMEACWSFVAADGMILLMTEDKPQGSQSGTWVTSHPLLPRMASWACGSWPCAQKSLVLGLILRCHCLEILNNFIFELVFCKEGLWGNAWVEKICILHASTILAAL